MPFDDKKLRSKLKEQFQVWAMIESGEFGKVSGWIGGGGAVVC